MGQCSLITAEKSKSPSIMRELNFFSSSFQICFTCPEGVFENPGGIFICLIISKCDFSHTLNNL